MVIQYAADYGPPGVISARGYMFSEEPTFGIRLPWFVLSGSDYSLFDLTFDFSSGYMEEASGAIDGAALQIKESAR